MMKSLYVFLFFFTLSSCGGLSARDRGRDRDPPRDSSKGVDEFDLPDIEDIDVSEDKKSIGDVLSGAVLGCINYEQHTCRVNIGIGSWDPRNKALNCLVESIDSNLKPLCETEQRYKRALRHYERTGDEDKVEEIKIALDNIDDEKQELTHDFYEMSDDIYGEAQTYADEKIDERKEKKKEEDKYDIWERAGTILGRAATRDTFGAATRCVDKRANQVCRTIDLKRFREKPERN